MSFRNRDAIEFYIEGEEGHTAVASSSMVPPVGSEVVIRKVCYLVTRVQFCVDHADDVMETGVRCTVDIVPRV